MTSVSEQLRRLAVPQAKLTNLKDDKRPSLLYDYSTAAMLDRDSYHAIGFNGLEELSLVDPGFQKLFYKDLFSDKAKNTERAVQMQAVNDKLDRKINQFLLYVSPYLLRRAAWKCIEWLLYRFHIASFNVDGLMKCVLPYHSTNVFIRFIGLLDVQHPTHKWHWLSGLQKEGVTLATSHLVIRCERDPTFVAFICQLVEEAQQLQQQVDSKWPMDVIVNVFTSTMVGFIHNMKTLGKTSSEKLRPVISAIHKGVQSSDENMNASCLVLLSQICSKVQLKGEVLEMLFKLLVFYHPRTLDEELVKMIVLSCQTQEKLNHLSFETLDFLYSNEDFSQLFANLNESGRIDRFLQFLIEASIKFLYKGDGEKLKERSEQFVRLIKSVPLTEKLTTLSLKLMIDGFVDLSVEERKNFYEIIAPVLNSLQQRYPQQFDDILSPYYSSGGSGDIVEALNTLFQMSVSSVKHRPLHGGDISVSLALMHKDSEIQIQALKQISSSLTKMSSTSAGADEMNKTTFIMDNVVSILSTESSPRLVDEVCAFVEAHVIVVVERLDLIADQLVKKILLHSDEAEWTSTIQTVLKLLCNEDFHQYGVEHETNVMDVISLTHLAVIHYLLSSNMNKKFVKQLGSTSNSSIMLRSILLAATGAKVEEKIIESVRTGTSEISTYKRRLSNFISACSNTIEPTSRCSPAIYCLIAAGIKIARPLSNVHLLRTLSDELIAILSSPTVERGSKMLQLLHEVALALDEIRSKHPLDGAAETVYERIFVFFCSQLGRKEECAQIAFTKCFRSIFTNLETSAMFLSSMWCSEELQACKLPCEFVHLSIVHLLQQLLVSASNTKQSNKHMSGSHLRVFRLILVAMTSQYKHIRHASIVTLKTFQPLIKGNKGMVEFVELIVSKHEEVEVDDQQISYLAKQFFKQETGSKKMTAAKLETRRKLLSGLMGNSSFDRFFAHFVTRVFEKTHNATILLELVDTSRQLLDVSRIENVEFPADQCNLLQYAISRITPCLVGKNEDVKELFYNCLKINNPIANNVTQMDSFALVASRDFYKELDDKRSLLTIIFDVASSSTDIQVIQACRKAFKAITVDGELLEMELKSSCGHIGKAKSKTSTSSSAAAAAGGKTEDQLKRLITLLDMVQGKKRITNSEKLIEPLFSLLNQIMKTSSWNFNFDCTCQLAMASLLNLFDRFRKNNSDRKHLHTTVERIVNVQLLVEYVRSCENVQTCQQAILLLASIASIYPEKVLHSVMSVFTFMGSNLLQRDDSFSFQIISQAIKTILPTILGGSDDNDESVLAIIGVFVDAFPDIPAHRRSMVFKELVETVGEEKYLSKLIYLLIDQTLTNREQNPLNTSVRVESGDPSDTSLETCINDWCSICKLFDINSQLQAIVKLLTFIQQIPTTQVGGTSDGANVVKFEKKSDYYLRRYILVALTFSSNLLQTSKNMITRRLGDQAEDDEEKQTILSTFERLVETILAYIHHISRTVKPDTTAAATADTSSSDRYQKALTHRLNELLTRTNSLLPTMKFLSVVKSLMKDGNEIFLLHRSVHLFNNRISYLATSMSSHEMEAVVGLCEQFFNVFTTACASTATDEADSLLQSTAVALKHVFRICDRALLMKYQQFITPLCAIVNNNLHRPKVVMSALLIIGEMCVKLKARCIAHLPKICGCLANFFDHQSAENLLALNIALQTTQKLFNTVPHFLGPYLKIFIPRLCMLASSRRMSFQPDGDQKAVEKRAKKLEQQGDVGEQITVRLRSLLIHIPTHMKLTSIMDSLADCYDVINTSSTPIAISPLIHSTTILSARFSKENTSNYSARLFMFYIKALDFRGHHKELSLDDVDYVEKETLNGVLTLFLKLPEAAFTTLFKKLNQWAEADSFLFSRTCSYYRCVGAIVDKLKILFTTSATTIVDHLVQVLTISHKPLSTDTDVEARIEEEKFLGLKYAVETLRLSLLYCGKSYMDQKRTDKLLEPLVNQLEITSYSSTLADAYVTDYVIPCIGEMAVSCADAVSWQPLNQHILSKAKHDDEKVRCRAPSAILHLVERLGDDYRVVLPELVPYFDEMNEDDSPMVVSHCRKIIQQLDDIFDQYFQKNIDD